MKNEFKKTLCLLMVLLLTISMMPAGVFAENVQPDPNIGAVASAPAETKATTNLSVKTDPGSAENPAAEKTAAATPSSTNEKIALPQLDNTATVIADTSVPETVQTQTVSGDFTYEDIEGGVSITKYSGTAMAEVTIPDTLDGKNVVQIGSGAFDNRLTSSVIVGNNVRTIKSHAFSNYFFKKAIIPATTTTIEDGAFTTTYTALKIFGEKGSAAEAYAGTLSNVTFFAFGADENNYWYKDVDGGVAITYYGGTEKAVSVPSTLGGKTVVSIASTAFSDNSTINSIEFKNGLKAIENGSFYGFYSLTTFYIPETVTEIGANAFTQSSSIKIIGKKGSYAETYAATLYNTEFLSIDNSDNAYWFEDVDGGVKITFYGGSDNVLTIPATLNGKAVVAIGKNAFNNCDFLTAVTIPDSVTTLDEPGTYSDGIFRDCGSLVKLTLGKGITHIPAYMATNCLNLNEVIFNGNVVSIGNNAFNQCAKLQTVKLPESLETIGNNAFYRCKSLTSLTIPNKTTSIGSAAFVYCEKLENLSFGDSLTTLNIGAFSYCNSLKEVTLPKSLTTIDTANVFIGCLSLSKVVIPETTTSITSNIFYKSPLVNIYGSNGSYAQTYAQKYGIPFIPVQANADVNVLYQTHVENYGWQDWKSNGTMSGTSHEALRLEAINIKLDQQKYDLSVNYATHVENYGWQGWKKDGAMSGTSHEALRLEAIRINLSGADADKFDIYYHVHAQNVGWMGWAKNGADAGTAGFAYRLEAIEIQVLPKGSPAPGSTENPFQENK